MSSGNRWDVVSMREYTDRTGVARTHWTKIGAAFTNQNGSINVQLDAMPLDGKMQLQVPLTQAEKEAKFSGQGCAMRQNQNEGGRPLVGQGFQRGPAASRFGGRGPSQPQQQQFAAPPPEYSPDPNGYTDDAQEDPYPGSRIGASQWDIHGQIINDARQLPNDHPDYLPF